MENSGSTHNIILYYPFYVVLYKIKIIWCSTVALIGSQLYVCIRLCKCSKHYLCRIFYNRNIKRLPCLHTVAWCKHLTEFGRTQKSLCKHLHAAQVQTNFRVLPNSLSCLHDRLCKHSTRFIFLKCSWGVDITQWQEMIWMIHHDYSLSSCLVLSPCNHHHCFPYVAPPWYPLILMCLAKQHDFETYLPFLASAYL